MLALPGDDAHLGLSYGYISVSLISNEQIGAGALSCLSDWLSVKGEQPRSSPRKVKMVLLGSSRRSNQLHTPRAPLQNEKHLRGLQLCRKQGHRSTEH